MVPNNGRPGDARGFVHKRLIGAVTGFAGGLLSGGNPITGAIGGFARGGRSTQVVPSRSNFPINIQPAPRTFGGACAPGFQRDSRGNCVPFATTGVPKSGFRPFVERLLPGGATGEFEFGEAVVGRFGAALEPGVRETDNLVCPRGTVLGIDNLCYNKRDIKNSERKWPVGRRPLLTGGEMRCITIAAGAAKRLQRKQKQLQALGMLKKPARRASKRLASGHHAHVEHD